MSTIENTRLIGKVRKHFDSLPSTNDYLLDMIASGGAEEGIIVSTDFQTKGRGQHLKRWHSLPGENLLFSLLVQPCDLGLERLFDLNRFVSLAVLQTLQTLGVKDPAVKWPNDVYIGDHKVAGILIQNSLREKRIGNVVIGIGLNVNQQQWPDDIPRPTSIGQKLRREIDRNDVFERLVENINTYYALLQNDSSKLVDAYQDYLYQRDTWSAYELADGSVLNGKIRGVDEHGRLELEVVNGASMFFAHHQITFL